MAVHLVDDKPFVCPVVGCGQGFTTEDRLAVHRRKHENAFPFPISLDQTPTPSHFLKDCDSLFLPNPFEESFKRVNSCEPPLLVPGPTDTVSTPSIVCREDDMAAAVAAASLVPAQLPLLSDAGSVDALGNLSASVPCLRPAPLPGAEAVHLAHPTDSSSAANSSATRPATADLFKVLQADECLVVEDDEALGGGSDVDAVTVVSESAPPPVGLAAKSTLSMTTAARGCKVQQQQTVQLGGSTGFLRPPIHLTSASGRGNTGGSSGAAAASLGSPAGRLADGRSSSSNAGSTILNAVGSPVVTAAGVTHSMNEQNIIQSTAPVGMLPGTVGAAAAAAAPLTAVGATQCTMQLLLHMPNGQTVPISLPAAIFSPHTSLEMSGIVPGAAKPQQAALAAAVPDRLSSSGALPPLLLAAGGGSGGASSSSQVLASSPSAAASPSSSVSSCDAAAGALSGKTETSAGMMNTGLSLAKQKLKESLQRDGAATGVSSTGNSLFQPAFKAMLQRQHQQFSDHCVGSTTGVKLKRPRQSSSEEDPEDKRGKFLERNREAARRCRTKKKEWITNLEQRNEELQNIQLRMQSEIAALRAEVADLKSLLLEHKDCPVTQLQKQSGRIAFSRPGSVPSCQESSN